MYLKELKFWISRYQHMKKDIYFSDFNRYFFFWISYIYKSNTNEFEKKMSLYSCQVCKF